MDKIHPEQLTIYDEPAFWTLGQRIIFKAEMYLSSAAWKEEVNSGRLVYDPINSNTDTQ